VIWVLNMNQAEFRYPLMEHAADQLRAASGRPLAEVTLDASAAGALAIADLQVSAETLRAQAEVARRAGYVQLAENLARAAELVAAPNAELLRMYDLLRPGRASFEELEGLAAQLEREYAAPMCAALVREAAEVYRRRGLLRPNTGHRRLGDRGCQSPTPDAAR
jgi:propanediol dehydratase small subunit